jgi:hypothetical protein
VKREILYLFSVKNILITVSFLHETWNGRFFLRESWNYLIQFYTVQCSTVYTVQYSTLQYSTVQYSTVQYSTVQYSTVHWSTVHQPLFLYFRLERNQEREQGLSNLEYLKNIIMKVKRLHTFSCIISCHVLMSFCWFIFLVVPESRIKWERTTYSCSNRHVET